MHKIINGGKQIDDMISGGSRRHDQAGATGAALARIRKAVLVDVPALCGMHRASIQVLCAEFYTPEEISGFLADIETADAQLIKDGTYYVAECGGVIAASGGWTMRRPDFERRLDRIPTSERIATIRAIFTAPAFAGLGLGRKIMDLAETEAVVIGQAERIELCATLSAVGFYRRLGYVEDENGALALSNGSSFGFRRM